MAPLIRRTVLIWGKCVCFEEGTKLSQWQDITGQMPLNFGDDSVSFDTTVSGRSDDTVRLLSDLFMPLPS